MPLLDLLSGKQAKEKRFMSTLFSNSDIFKNMCFGCKNTCFGAQNTCFCGENHIFLLKNKRFGLQNTSFASKNYCSFLKLCGTREQGWTVRPNCLIFTRSFCPFNYDLYLFILLTQCDFLHELYSIFYNPLVKIYIPWNKYFSR